MRSRFWGFLAACFVAFAALAGGASAGPESTVDSAVDEIRWEGSVIGAAPIVANRCGASCDIFDFEISLPPGTWRRDGGVQVGIRWADEGDDLELSVYDANGIEIARSQGAASTAELISIPRPANGSYQAVVSVRPDQVIEGRFHPDVMQESVEYEGLIEIEWTPRAHPIRDLLPNLISFEPRNVAFGTGAYLFDPGVSATSCYPDEVVEAQARRCLRFDQIIANSGEGAMELRFRMEGLATEQPILQRIYATDGSHHDRTADTYEFHATHAHFHYKNFGQARLWASNPAGERLGDEPVATGNKVGFCPIDIENFRFGEDGDAPRTYFFERCNNPTESDATGTYMVTGISPGWADVYNWFLADQYIEVSGVPDGYYLLESIADPAQTVVESEEIDNSSEVLIEICGESVDIAGTTHFCSGPSAEG